jgi:pimeloyl-ACP methyl ester carboxylesterase
MAADGMGVLDALGVDKAHIVGASMGGMIAQLIAIHHPERVRTLTSIMSTTGNPRSAPCQARSHGRADQPPDQRRRRYAG